MKTFEFPYYVSFGRGDSVDCSIEVELNDEQASRLEESARAEPRFRLLEDRSLHDIYSLVLNEIKTFEKGQLEMDPSPVEDALSWRKDYDPNEPVTDEQIEEYIDYLDMGINFPKELQMIE